MRKLFFLLLVSTAFVPANAQESAKENQKEKKPLMPFVGLTAVSCGVSNLFSLLAGVQQPFKKHLTLVYDLHYMNTHYECDCDGNVHSKGHFSSFIPSVKMQYYSGKKQGRGLIAGIGLGYMFARDRGTEQQYMIDLTSKEETLVGEIRHGRWDFNSIAPSFTVGAGFRLFRLPAFFGQTLYFARDTERWDAQAGGVEFHLGLKKIPK